jgi:DNA-binding HxlR family transcriptional regulator
MLLVVEALLGGPQRFNDLLGQIPGIAANILSERLKRLEQEGLLITRPYSERPPRAAYQLTAEDTDLASSLNNLSNGLADLGRREAALAANAEATGIHRELAVSWPDVYHHELEQSLQVAAWLENGQDLSDAYSRESKA